jgi:hypothetical protein
LKADRANFALVYAGSGYLPQDGKLDAPVQLLEIRWRGFGGIKGERQKPDQGKPKQKTGDLVRKLEGAIRQIKSTLRNVQEVLSDAKGGMLDVKRKKQEAKAEQQAVDIQCGEIRKQVKYSKKWQKMKRSIRQEFHLKWKRWVFFKWNAESSKWEKLPPPNGALDPDGKYRLVIRPQDEGKRARPGKLRRRERRQQAQVSPGVKKLQTFQWSTESQDQVQKESAKEPSPKPFTVEKRQPSPPLQIVKRAKEPIKVWVDLVLDGVDWKSMEVERTATQSDIEVKARDIFDTAISIKNYHPPEQGIKYYCRVDEEENRRKEQNRREVQFRGGVPGTTQRREADEEERGRVQEQRQLRQQQEGLAVPQTARAGSVPRPGVEQSAPQKAYRAPSAEKQRVTKEEPRLPVHTARSPTPGRPPAKSQLINQKVTMLWMNDFSPGAEVWQQQWEGEPKSAYKYRTSKERDVWLSRTIKMLTRDKTKDQSKWAFYEDLILREVKP